jgi:hypothetical protein
LFCYLALRVTPRRLGSDMVVVDCILMYMHEEDKGDYERDTKHLDGMGWDGRGWESGEAKR